MKKIKSYFQYFLESVLYVDDKLTSVLKRIEHPIADILLKMIGTDVKLTFNRLKSTDKNSMVEFIPDNRVGDAPNWEQKGNEGRIGRVVKDILTKNGHKFSDKDIEEFVTKFKASYDSSNTKEELIKIVKGDDIRHWYLLSNYEPNDGGTLNKSCMRYKKCQTFFDIYTKNEDVCSMIILLNEKGLLEARAILWKLSSSSKSFEYFLDRIYYNKEEQKEIVKNWFKQKFKDKTESGILGSYDDGSVGTMKIELKNYDLDYYPYMDTFSNLDGDILNNDGEGDKELQDTDGGSSVGIYCEAEGESYPEDVVVYLEDGSYCHQDNARYCNRYGRDYYYTDVVYSEYEDDNIPENDAVFSDELNSWLFSEGSTSVYTSLNRNNEDYLPNSELNRKYAEDGDTGEYYLIELLVKTSSGTYVKEDSALECFADVNDKQNFYTVIDSKIYNISLNMENRALFSVNEYYDSMYSEKIFVKEVAKIREAINKLQDNGIENDESDAIDKLEQYTEWNNKKMVYKDNYYKLQMLYKLGGWNEVIEKKRNLFWDKFNELVPDDKFKELIDMIAGLANEPSAKSSNGYKSIITLDYEIPFSNYKAIKELFTKLMNDAMIIREYEHDKIMEFIGQLQPDPSGFIYFLFKKVAFIFKDSESYNGYSRKPFMYWGNEDWETYLNIGNGLIDKTINIANKELKS